MEVQLLSTKLKRLSCKGVTAALSSTAHCIWQIFRVLHYLEKESFFFMISCAYLYQEGHETPKGLYSFLFLTLGQKKLIFVSSKEERGRTRERTPEHTSLWTLDEVEEAENNSVDDKTGKKSILFQKHFQGNCERNIRQNV